MGIYLDISSSAAFVIKDGAGLTNYMAYLRFILTTFICGPEDDHP